MQRLLLVVALIVLWGVAPQIFSASPTSHVVAASIEDKGKPDAKVWVNTGSGVYHCPGTRWYGKTKQGEYMTQKQAQDKGYRPAYGKVCQ